MNTLTNSQCDSYKQQGFLILESALDESWLGKLSDAADLLALDVGPLVMENPRIQIEKTQQGICIRQAEPLIDLSPVFREFSQSEDILSPLRYLFNDEPVLFEDKINYKNPGGGTAFPVHQDYAFWTKFPPSLVTVLIYIDEATTENGCLQVVPEQHTQGLLPHHRRPVGLSNGLMINTEAVEGWSPNMLQAPGAAGTMLIFSCLTPHQSLPNMSDRPRRAIIYTYNPALEGDFYAQQEGPNLERCELWRAGRENERPENSTSCSHG
jgi:hypothetical protein